MTSKRHLVLYGIGAIVLLAIASSFMVLKKDRLSNVPQESAIATISALSAPEEPRDAVSAPATPRKPFQFEIVTTQVAQTKGLSNRTEIPSDYGMLFVFSDKEVQNFWMKDMLASIDIIWVSDEGVVVGIEREVSPATYPKTFTSPEAVRYVLETKAGEASRLGIAAGTKLNLPAPYGR